MLSVVPQSAVTSAEFLHLSSNPLPNLKKVVVGGGVEGVLKKKKKKNREREDFFLKLF